MDRSVTDRPRSERGSWRALDLFVKGPHDDLRLRIHPDPVLRQKAEPVGAVTEQVRELARQMLTIMRDEEGIGLAAPQVGVARRVFICDVPSDEDPADAEGVQRSTDGPLVCIDPEISEHSDDRTPFEEGCLSIPGIRGEVIRPERVRLTATGLDGERFSIVADGLLSRCIQHEADHLDGVLILDKFTQMSRLKNRRKIREIEARA